MSFDLVGDRHPSALRGGLTNWMLGHLPAAMSIAATGAAMVSLVAHAADDRAPEATAIPHCGAGRGPSADN